MRRLRTTLASLVLAGFAVPAYSAPARTVAYTPPTFSASIDVGYDAPTYDTVNIAPAGQDVPDISVFFDELAPYGSWYDDATYGWVFAPNNPNYVPYTNGHWMDTDYGMLWVSNDPFGWATDHYGRWVFLNR